MEITSSTNNLKNLTLSTDVTQNRAYSETILADSHIPDDGCRWLKHVIVRYV
jgi:hypothetical protein